ncbi:hypothetical protein [Anaerosoma tenue]|uniref:hypothetical protein n=1 Tax=Anaerosoma tenue TaxID=2933588 RepID=UPI002260ACC7|nr:hypothetical protein [Anaerosoma tenue]MCK8114949.1 hypothetical protein [Anaerosoma tenue]
MTGDGGLVVRHANGNWTRDALLRLALVGLAFVALSAVAGCQSDTGEPGAMPDDAVVLLAEAAEDGDWTGVRTYMDANGVGLAFAADTMARARDEDASAGGSSMHGGDFPASAMEQTFADQFVESLQAGVENGTVVADGTLFGAILEDSPGEVEYVGDDEALVSVTVPDEEGADQALRLRMARSGQRWMLIAIEGTTDLYGLFF